MHRDEKHGSDTGIHTSSSKETAYSSSLVTRHLSLFVASSNPGKLREFRAAAAARNITVEVLPGFAEMPVCIEDGNTFEANARKKAVHYSRNAPGWVFADDSGICVDALNGAPGVYSARFAGPQATDEQNNRRLLSEIHAVEARHRAQSRFPRPDQPDARAAHYICVIALAEAGQVLAVVAGRADGVIIDPPRGTGGFGYDPCFLYPPLHKTFADMDPNEKFAVSHRGIAFRKLLDYVCLLQPCPGSVPSTNHPEKS